MPLLHSWRSSAFSSLWKKARVLKNSPQSSIVSFLFPWLTPIPPPWCPWGTSGLLPHSILLLKCPAAAHLSARFTCNISKQNRTKKQKNARELWEVLKMSLILIVDGLQSVCVGPNIKLYTLNMSSSLYIHSTSIKLSQNNAGRYSNITFSSFLSTLLLALFFSVACCTI